MKKNNITLIAAIALMAATAACSKKKDEGEKPVLPHPVLGTITFATTQTWTVGSQTWSDAVQVSAADKTTFDGGESGNFKADWRSNPGQKGSLFSWAAVNQYKAALCPAPWRVPTKEDFINLDKALGGTGNNDQTDATLRDKYLNDWGGAYGGWCTLVGTLHDQGSFAFYWSQSECGAGAAYNLYFGADNRIWPQDDGTKSNGNPVRCVK